MPHAASDAVDAIIAQWNAQCPGLDVSPMQVLTRLFRFNAFANDAMIVRRKISVS